MFRSVLVRIIIIFPVVAFLTACDSLPGNRRSQGAVVGGAAGAAAGAAVSKNNRLLGAIIGGALGAGGGYVIAAKTDKIENRDQQAATRASRQSQERPATASHAQNAATADLNGDGFVTLDEVVAMKQAGFSDEKMLEKLTATDQVFELTSEQEKYLMDRGVSRHIVNQMNQINQNKREALLNRRTDVISQDPASRH